MVAVSTRSVGPGEVKAKPNTLHLQGTSCGPPCFIPPHAQSPPPSREAQLSPWESGSSTLDPSLLLSSIISCPLNSPLLERRGESAPRPPPQRCKAILKFRDRDRSHCLSQKVLRKSLARLRPNFRTQGTLICLPLVEPILPGASLDRDGELGRACPLHGSCLKRTYICGPWCPHHPCEWETMLKWPFSSH